MRGDEGLGVVEGRRLFGVFACFCFWRGSMVKKEAFLNGFFGKNLPKAFLASGFCCHLGARGERCAKWLATPKHPTRSSGFSAKYSTL